MRFSGINSVVVVLLWFTVWIYGLVNAVLLFTFGLTCLVFPGVVLAVYLVLVVFCLDVVVLILFGVSWFGVLVCCCRCSLF